MSNNYITLTGTILFEPENVTKKHKLQAEWKRTAFVMFKSDICEYYSWFLKKRYNLILNKPLRGPHISWVNDRTSDFNDNFELVKEKWSGKEIEITLDVDLRSDQKHWWLNIPHEHREQLHNIRSEMGLNKPYWGLHMSIGYASHLQLEHSEYILRMINAGLIT